MFTTKPNYYSVADIIYIYIYIYIILYDWGPLPIGEDRS